jgi:hypothetical protein
MKFWLLISVLSVTGCCGSGKDYNGPPEVGAVGTSTDGSSYVGWVRTYLFGCYEVHEGGDSSYVLVSATGAQTAIDRPPALLAKDCSDQPSELGTCVPATMTDPIRSNFSYLLEGNDHVVAASDVISRMTADGTTLWSVAGCHASEPIRGTTLLVACYSHVELLDVDTGVAIWSVQAPDNL